MDATLGIYAASIVMAAASALIPVINAELYLAGLVLLVGGDLPRAIVLGCFVAFGQMLGKSIVYLAMRGTARFGWSRTGKIAAARALVARWGDRPQLLMFLSATASVPPYLLVAMLAGLMKIRYRVFFTIGLVGRTLRFVTIAVIAALV